ncbi:MAG: glycosyltransferase [Alphaproteobacteria bacterium]|nr:glycosyltransferase [Alphaproteobacteria bacterium]
MQLADWLTERIVEETSAANERPRAAGASVTPRAQARPTLLSVVCPCYNEEAALSAFELAVRTELSRLGQPFEIVFVNDGSRDATLSVMRALRAAHGRIAIVDLSRNFGKEVATTAGLDHAKGDAAVVMDADLQDPPKIIGELIAGWREGYDVVYAKRMAREGDSWLKKATAGAFYAIMRNVGEAPIPENVGDFRLLSRKAIDAVCAIRERHRFMKGVFAWVGFPSKEVPYFREPRSVGSTKWNYWKLWNLSIEGVTSSTLAPLKLSTYFGFSTALAAFVLGVFYAAKTIILGDPVAGFPTLIVVILFMGGVQLMVLGVMGEYVGRIFNETKRRPLYFVSEFVAPESAVVADPESGPESGPESDTESGPATGVAREIVRDAEPPLLLDRPATDDA